MKTRYASTFHSGYSNKERDRKTMKQRFSAQVLTRKPLPLLPLHGACPEPLALSDSEWVETCPERSEWRERVRQASGTNIILFQNETDLKQISLTAL
jgi:hypothetical protein